MFRNKFSQIDTPLSISVILLVSILGSHVATSQTIYSDGGRNVIPLVKYKPMRVLPYNDGTVMAHVIGSAGMNFLYYFHILGVACENNDPQLYKIIQQDFAFCLNKTGPLPSQLDNQPLGSIPKPCVDWKIHKPCYKNLAEDYDECLMNRNGLAKKGTDTMRFTHAYAKFVCGNIADTEAHLLDRYTKHDLIVDGVFQCFPHLQDRIVGCVKKDKISKTLCSKFYVVHACFGKYYNDDNCRDVQPIYYMDDLFRNMSTSLNCPKNENDWINRPPQPPPPTRPPTHGWDSREEHSRRENPFPGEMGRPWPNEGDRNPYISNQHQQNHHHQGHHQHQGWESGDKSKGTMGRGWGSGERGTARTGTGGRGRGSGERSTARTGTGERGWGSGERSTARTGTGERGCGSGEKGGRDWGSGERYSGWQSGKVRGSSRVITDTHSHRPHSDSNFNSKPWVDVMDRGTSVLGKPWDQRRYSNNLGSRAHGSYSPTPRGPASSYQFTRKLSTGIGGGYHDSTTARGPGSGYVSVSLPPAGYASTRTPYDESDREVYVKRSSSQEQSTVSQDENDQNNANFYSFK